MVGGICGLGLGAGVGGGVGLAAGAALGKKLENVTKKSLDVEFKGNDDNK